MKRKNLIVMRMTKVKVFMFLLCLSAVGVFLGEPNSKMFSQKVYREEVENTCDFRRRLSENDTWFMRRFNYSIEPFLSAHGDLSVSAFNWWRRLQAEQRGYHTYRETVNTLFRIFPPRPDLLEPRQDECRTCAVVGNSVNLMGSGYGPLIDLHDVIIRMNHGQVQGYEADVGNRTTHRIMYPESSMDLDESGHLVLFPFKIKDLEWLLRVFTAKFIGTKYSRTVKSTITGSMDLVTVLNPAFMKYVHEVWLDKKGRYSSTGFMTVVLALHLCGEVNVFGYGADKEGNWSHYWEKLKIKSYKTGIHPGNYEYELIHMLADKHIISFYPGR